MTTVSHAQNGEDIVLARALGPVEHGFYVDVGAADPDVHSVTKLFYERGWSGVNIEPESGALADLRSARPRDTNLGIGVGAEEGELRFFQLPRRLAGNSTFQPALAERYEREGVPVSERTVPVRTLAQVLAEHVGERTIDFLKIDVEGAERDVLAGADFSRFRPRAVVVEATVPGTSQPSHESWEPFLVANGYTATLFDGLNRFYVREEEDEAFRSALSVPANVLDDYIDAAAAAWRDEASRAAELGRVLEGARGDLERAGADLRRAGEDLDTAARELAGAHRERNEALAALEQTRLALAGSEARRRDMAAELAAARTALIEDVRASRGRAG